MIGKTKVKITEITEFENKLIIVYEHDFPTFDLEDDEGILRTDNNCENLNKLQKGKEYYLGFEEISEPNNSK